MQWSRILLFVYFPRYFSQLINGNNQSIGDYWHALARLHINFSTNDFHNELFPCSLINLYESFSSDIKHTSAFMFRYTVTTNTPETSWMANYPSNSSFNVTQEKAMTPGLGASQCISWLVVLITECLATVILNIITITRLGIFLQNWAKFE